MRSEPGAPAPEGGIPLAVPEIGGNEWAYVKDCLDTGWVSSVGAWVTRFERDLAGIVGARHAVAIVNGTAAIHLALLAAGVAPGDEVVVPALTFVAPANAVRYLGAWPVFVDVEARHGQLDAERLAGFLREGCTPSASGLRNRATGRIVKALLPVHLLGHPCDLDAIAALAREFGLPVVEDATESLGARYRGRPVGRPGDLACFSFNGNKILTTGGGGMVVTDREDWARRVRHLSTQAKQDPVEFVHDEVGFNHRLTNVQAAIGCAQLERLDAFVEKKRAIAERYARELADVPGLLLPGQAEWAHSTFWLYTIRVDASAFGRDSRALMQSLGEEGIQARPLWQPLHRSPAHRGSAAVGGEVADELQRTSLSLPSSVGLTDAQQERVIRAVRRSAGRPA